MTVSNCMFVDGDIWRIYNGCKHNREACETQIVKHETQCPRLLTMGETLPFANHLDRKYKGTVTAP